MRASLGALLAGVAVLAGCTAPDAEEPTATPSMTARAILANDPTAPTTRPVATSTPAATAGVVSVDPATGEVTEIWVGADRFFLLFLYPELTAGGDAVWLNWWDREDAERFDLEGRRTAELTDAVTVIESPDGRTVAYHLGPAGSLSGLVVEREGSRFDVKGACCPSISEGGLVAFFASDADEGDRRILRVLDPADGSTFDVMGDIELPGKEGMPRAWWSPSGRYVSYATLDHDQGATEQRWVVADAEAKTSSIVPPHGWQGGPNGEDWTWRVEDSEVVYRDAATQQATLRLPAHDESSTSSVDLGGAIALYRHHGDADDSTLVYDLRGAVLKEFEGYWVVTMTPDGPAGYRLDREGGLDRCLDGEIDHPAFHTAMDCMGDQQHWSPGGRYLALVGAAGDGLQAVRIIDMHTGLTKEIDLRGEDHGVQWTPDGSRLLVHWGGGL